MTEDPALLYRYRGFNDAPTCVKFHPDGQQLAGCAKDKNILIWNLSNDNKAFKYSGHTDAIFCLDYSPNNGRLLASCSRDQTVRLWITKKSLRTENSCFKAHGAAIRSVEFSPSDGGQHLLSASDDKSVKLWAVQRQKFIGSMSKHNNWVRCARFSPDGNCAASCSDDKTIKVFDLRSFKEVLNLPDSKGHALYLDFHPGGTCLAAGTADKKVKIYDIRMNKLQQLYSTHESAVTQVSFHCSGNYLVSSSKDGSLKMYDLLEARPIYDLRGHEKEVTAVCFSPDGSKMASAGTGDNHVILWKTNLDKEELVNTGITKDNQKEKREQLRTEIEKCNVLLNGDKENFKSKNLANIEKVNNSENVNKDLKEELKTTKEQVEVLTETVILLEKRICLLEDQLKLSTTISK